MSNLSPIIAPVGAYLYLKDRLTIGQKIAIPLCLLGLVLVAQSSASEPAISWGTCCCLEHLRRSPPLSYFSKKMDLSLGSSFALIIVLAIYLAPVGVLGGLESSSLARVPPAAGLRFSGWRSQCAVLTLAHYLRGLRFITVSESAILLLIQILTGLALAYVLLGEGLTFYGILGACLLSLAALLSSLKLGKSAALKTRTNAQESA